MKLYFLQDELNELTNFIVCCNHDDFEKIHDFYYGCYFDVNVFKNWFFENFTKTMDYIGVKKIVFTKNDK